ncbi:MAG: rod shape-determining protein MreD [Gemmatimonadota bacterium]|nr:rod shape-determining protein MreD [Gemmatimonadota bacterium]
MRSRRGWVVIGLLLALHFALHPLWTGWPAGPDLLIGGLLLGSLGLRASRAALLGFILGLFEASMSLGPLGPTMLILAATGYAGSWLRDVFYSDSARFIPAFLVVGVWLVQTLLVLAGGAGLTLEGALIHSPISAGLTAVLCWGTEKLVAFFVG